MKKQTGLIRPIGHIRYFRNEKGIALVMVLVLSMIGLAIVSALLFMLTQGTRVSGYHKIFKSADEAGLGGASVVVDMIKNRGTATVGTLPFALDACLQQKLSIARGVWSSSAWTSCAAERLTQDAADNPDMTVTLPGPPGTSFTTSMKIIDTVQGNTDPGGLVPVGTLGGTGVVASIGGQITPPQIPYLYRIEVQTQDNTNPRERSRYSVLYGY